jgi:hypothetical protein
MKALLLIGFATFFYNIIGWIDLQHSLTTYWLDLHFKLVKRHNQIYSLDLTQNIGHFYRSIQC